MEPVIPYSDWSKEELEEGIANVKAQIAALQEEAAAKAEARRLKKISKLERGIADAQAELMALAGPLDLNPPTKKRKRAVKGGGRKAKGGGKRRKVKA